MGERFITVSASVDTRNRNVKRSILGPDGFAVSRINGTVPAPIADVNNFLKHLFNRIAEAAPRGGT